MELPDGFVLVDCLFRDNFAAIATPTTKGRTFIVNKDLEIGEVQPGKIFLPEAEIRIEVPIEEFSPTEIDEKYDEFVARMDVKRCEMLNNLKSDVGTGTGLYYYFLFAIMPASKTSWVFREGFSAVWAEGRIISKLDYPFTVH